MNCAHSISDDDGDGDKNADAKEAMTTTKDTLPPRVVFIDDNNKHDDDLELYELNRLIVETVLRWLQFWITKL